MFKWVCGCVGVGVGVGACVCSVGTIQYLHSIYLCLVVVFLCLALPLSLFLTHSLSLFFSLSQSPARRTPRFVTRNCSAIAFCRPFSPRAPTTTQRSHVCFATRTRYSKSNQRISGRAVRAVCQIDADSIMSHHPGAQLLQIIIRFRHSQKQNPGR